MDTCRLVGVVSLFGATDSHVSPIGLVVATALNGSGPPVLVTDTAWVVTDVDPTSAVTFMDGTPTFASGLVLTLRVTGTTSGGALLPGTVNVRLPVQVGGVPVSPLVFTAAVT